MTSVPAGRSRPVAAPGGDSRAGTPGGHAWTRAGLLWDGYYLAALLVSLLVVTTDRSTSGRAHAVACTALAAVACWYLALGRRVIRDASTSPRLAAVYLSGLLAGFAVAETQTLAATFLLIGLCPQVCFAAATFRQVVGFVLAINAAPAVTVAALTTGHTRAQALPECVAIGVLSAVFTLVIGSWVTGIIDQSRDRAQLIERLESTRAELAAANLEAGRLAERQRLASDIHDTVAQGLTSVVMLLEAAAPEIGRDDGAVRRYLERAATATRENLAETRALVAALTPAHLVAGGLADALRRLAGQQGALSVTVEVSGEIRPLPASTEVVLLRVCQEALANVRKHAQADVARVRLAYTSGSVRLEVADDGSGFDPVRMADGFGLRGMRGRVDEGGGTLTVRSTAGRGTTVRAEIPA